MRQAIVATMGLGLALLGAAGLLGGEGLGTLYIGLGAGTFCFAHRRLLPATVLLGCAAWLFTLAPGDPGNAALATAAVLGAGVAALAPRGTPAPANRPLEAAVTALRIGTLGTLRVTAAGREQTASLLSHPVLAQLWLLLLCRALTQPSRPLLRTQLADEVAPGLPSAAQLRRLRGQLHDLQRKLPPALVADLRLSPQEVAFDLSGWDVDLLRWRRLAAAARTTGWLDAGAAAEARQLIAEGGAGEFLPAWEEIQHRAGGGRGTASDLVAELRREALELRADVGVALARAVRAEGPAVAPREWLEQMLELSGREDLALAVAALLAGSGQLRRAASLTRGAPQGAG